MRLRVSRSWFAVLVVVWGFSSYCLWQSSQTKLGLELNKTPEKLYLRPRVSLSMSKRHGQSPWHLEGEGALEILSQRTAFDFRWSHNAELRGEEEFNTYLSNHECINEGCFKPSSHLRKRCESDVDFNMLVSNRDHKWGSNSITVPAYLEQSGLWQKSINNKLAAYLFARHNLVRVPKILHCTINGVEDLRGFSETTWKSFADRGGGFVIKPLAGHSAMGVNILEDGFGGKELLSGREGVTKEEVLDDVKGVLVQTGDNVVLVEER